jgi:hypothetical protein
MLGQFSIKIFKTKAKNYLFPVINYTYVTVTNQNQNKVPRRLPQGVLLLTSFGGCLFRVSVQII